MLAPQKCTANSVTVATTFLDAAAALEQEHHDTRLRNAQLEQSLREKDLALEDHRQREEHRQVAVQGWLRAIRRCHQRRSHAVTGQLIREAISSLESEPTARPLSFLR